MESRLASPDVSFDPTDPGDEEGFHASPAGYLPDMRYNPEVLVAQSDHESVRSEQLTHALARLDARARDIIQRRWLDEDKPTLHELAREYGVSAERIRQIEQKALAQMKGSLAA
jgi:RNA polymerase sigma-32 factor